MPKRENVPGRIGIAVVSDTALTGPLSGKKTALPRSPPLRTVRESFPSHGSSLYKLH